MKRILILIVAAFLAVPLTFAQGDHVEVGGFGDYVRLANAGNRNFWGVGGRAGFNVASRVQLEAEMTYDFSQSFNFNTNGTSVGGSIQTANLRMLQGLFGPKFEVGGPIKLYGTLKGGFLNFRPGNVPVTFGSVNDQLNHILTGNTDGVFYPGAGIEFFAGPIGIRAEVGDLMYFSNGAQNNLRITFGPTFRF